MPWMPAPWSLPWLDDVGTESFCRVLALLEGHLDCDVIAGVQARDVGRGKVQLQRAGILPRHADDTAVLIEIGDRALHPVLAVHELGALVLARCVAGALRVFGAALVRAAHCEE